MTSHITTDSLFDALIAEAAALRAATETRRMGHSSYVTKAMLKRNAFALDAMRRLVVRANGFRALPDDVIATVTAAVEAATTEAGK